MTNAESEIEAGIRISPIRSFPSLPAGWETSDLIDASTKFVVEPIE